MTFLNLGWPLVVLGAGALAAVLYLLQRLRVRHRQVPVMTTMFWKEAVEESRARVLVRRFRHPWAYVLILAISLLMWIALAGPESTGSGEAHHVVVLDGSARMARGDVFARAKAAAIRYAGDLPRRHREVILAGAEPRRVLAPGEDLLLLEKRLEGLGPDASPPRLDELLRGLRSAHGAAAHLAVVTDARLWERPELRVSRVPLETPALNNDGIVAIGLSEAASGRFDTVDVFVESRGQGTPPQPVIRSLGLDDTTFTPTLTSSRPAEGLLRTWIRDVPARGQHVVVALPTTDELTLDDETRVRLPNRRVLRVRVEASLRDLVAPIVLADPAFALTDGEADLAVVANGETTLPSLVFVTENADTPMLTVIDDAFGIAAPGAAPRARSADAVLADVHAALHLGEIDAVAIATIAGRSVEMRGRVGPRRGIEVWRSLATPRYDLVHSRSFPALISRALRWIARVEPLAPYVAAGEPTGAHLTTLTDDGGRARDALGRAAVPPRARAYGPDLIATLGAPALTDVPTTDARTLSAATAGGAGGNAVSWLLLLAFGLLLLEWHFFQTERIP